MRAKKINENITLLALGGMDSNCYLVNGELLIDTGTGFHPKAMVRALTGAGAVLEDVKRIILTHAHFDHTGGVHLFRSAKIGAHKDDAGIIENCSEDSMAKMFSAQTKPRKVDFTLDEGDMIKSGEMKLNVVHTPGHTKGSICLYDAEDKILFSGDTVFASGFGRMDLPGGNTREMRNSIESLRKLDVEMVLPGHGEIVRTGGARIIKNLLGD